MGMQTGDVPATWANADLLKTLTGYRPQTDFRDGIANLWIGIGSIPGNDHSCKNHCRDRSWLRQAFRSQ